MTTHLEFGHTLKYLLSILGISINKLSKAINVDNSLVNRWVNGKRIPAYNTNYIERISKYLAENTKNSLQLQYINELYSSLNLDYAALHSTEEKIKVILYEAQGHSLEKKKTRKIVKNQRKVLNVKRKYYIKNITGQHNSKDKIIQGLPNIISAITELLTLALREENSRQHKIIYITFFNNRGINNGYSNLWISISFLIKKLLAKGWKLKILLRINSNTNRSFEIIDFAKEIYGHGEISFYYIDNYCAIEIGRDYIVIPEVGSLSCFVLHGNFASAFKFNTPDATSIFENYLQELIISYSEPIMNQYPPGDYNLYLNDLLENENYIGDRYCYHYWFSVLTIPRNIYKKLLQRLEYTKDEIKTSMCYYDKRFHSFTSNITNYTFYHMINAESINELIKKRQLPLYDHFKGVQIVQLEIDELREIILNTIKTLETYDNYKIAIVYEKANRFDDHLFYCLIKQRHSFAFQAFNRNENKPELQFTITEPMMVRALEEYFLRSWERIAPLSKDKDYLISWLKQILNQLKTSNKKLIPHL